MTVELTKALIPKDTSGEAILTDDGKSQGVEQRVTIVGEDNIERRSREECCVSCCAAMSCVCFFGTVLGVISFVTTGSFQWFHGL